jgi:SAM-dependent methyltransferase
VNQSKPPPYEQLLAYLVRDLETIACPLCGASKFRAVRTARERGGFTIRAVVCRECGHIYLNPRPTLDAYEKFYYHSHYRAYVDQSEIEEINRKRMAEMQAPEYIQKRVAHGERLFDHFAHEILGKDDLVFDFGCGDGAWLEGLRKRCSCRISGSDPDLFYRDYIRKTYGFDIHIGVMEKMFDALGAEYRGKIKLAIVSGSLQHMVDPMACLKFIRDLLVEDGTLYICNKNVFTHKIRLNIPFSSHVSIDHPHYFHRSSYHFMVENAGFEVLAYNDHSKVRDKHMEIFARKCATPVPASPRIPPRAIIGELQSSAIKIAVRKRIASLRNLFSAKDDFVNS